MSELENTNQHTAPKTEKCLTLDLHEELIVRPEFAVLKGLLDSVGHSDKVKQLRLSCQEDTLKSQ